MTGKNSNHNGMVVAVSNHDNTYDYPEEVQFVIRQDQQNDYHEAAMFINESGADICILEHEFGIFGGQNGVYILPLLHRLKIPLIAVFHTVLKTPSLNERTVLTSICRIATRIVVMTQKAHEFLTDIYDIPERKIEVIAHGVPDLQFDQEVSKKEFGLENRKILMTFGLISRNKGIETVIKALPEVVAKHPEVIYIILGKTHPSVVKHSGEEYRTCLLQLVNQLQLEEHVIFMNEFVNEEQLFKYLSAADIYVTPYLNEAQITSGTLSYAVGAGCAVISTPYWHAEELLTNIGGCLFDFNNYKQLTSIFMDLLDHPDVLMEMRKKSHEYGYETTWSKIGEKYIALAKTIPEKQTRKPGEKEFIPGRVLLSSFSLDHIRRMTDSTGIMQHSKYGLPNFKEGYCLDDNARALLMALMTYKQQKHVLSIELIRVYLCYIHYMQNENGTFHNFLGFNRNFLDEKGTEDSFGRTIWALGYLLGNPPNDAYYQLSRELFFKAVQNFEKLHSLRGIANTLIGITYYLQRDPNHTEMLEMTRMLSDKLVRQYAIYKTEGWNWFESILTYDNAILPLSLLHAAEILGDEKILEIAVESMDFLSGITLKNGYLSVVGNEKWYEKDDKQSVFAQQPIDVMVMILMFQKGFLLTKNEIYLENLNTSFMWFLGKNDLGIRLYDFETKGCCDGLESYGVNRNQGAESTLAYLISHLVMLETTEQRETYTANRKDVAGRNGDLVTISVGKMSAL